MANKITIDNEFSIYSQSGEDGIIDHIFNIIGTTDKIAVEIGVSNNKSNNLCENNTYNLGLKGWKTFWFDRANTSVFPLNCVFTKTFLTADNVTDYFNQVNIPKEFDLLSIDIDSNDYYIRDALKEYKPRVCVMEYNGCYPADSNYIMKRDDNYSWVYRSTEFGASLKSYTEQANDLGYDLVYVNDNGVNAFFVRKDVNKFEILNPEKAWKKLIWYKG